MLQIKKPDRKLSGSGQNCLLLLLSVCLQIFHRQSIDDSMSHDNLTTYSLSASTFFDLLPAVHTSSHILSEPQQSMSRLSAKWDSRRSCCNQCLVYEKNTKSDSKRSIAIVNEPLFIQFDLSADLTQIIYDLAYWLTRIMHCHFRPALAMALLLIFVVSH